MSSLKFGADVLLIPMALLSRAGDAVTLPWTLWVGHVGDRAFELHCVVRNVAGMGAWEGQPVLWDKRLGLALWRPLWTSQS